MFPPGKPLFPLFSIWLIHRDDNRFLCPNIIGCHNMERTRATPPQYQPTGKRFVCRIALSGLPRHNHLPDLVLTDLPLKHPLDGMDWVLLGLSCGQAPERSLMLS